MNKLFTKIAIAFTSVAMAVGVGFAVSNSRNNSIEAKAAGGTDNITSSQLALSSTATNTWKTGTVSNTTSGAVYGYRFMGTSGTTDSRIATTNASGGIWTTTSGGVINTVTVTTTSAKSLILYMGTSAFSGYSDTADRYSITKTSSGSGSTYTASWTNLSSYNYSHILLRGNASSTYIKSISFAWTTVTTPAITIGTNKISVTTATQHPLSVGYSNLTANISVSQSSSDGGAVTLSTDGTSFSSSLTLNRTTTSPQTVYVKGVTAGTVTLSLSSTGATTKTVTVTVSEPIVYKKVTELALMKDGGSFVLLATGTQLAMSTTQLSNGREPITADIVDDDIYLASSTKVATLTITKGTGTYADYYTIFDPAYSNNGGYLEYYNSNLTTYYVSSTPSTDAYYWSISFTNGHVVLENKANTGNYIEFNKASNANCFRLYAGTQTKLDLYELESDIPSGVALTSITAANVSVNNGSTITYSGTYLPVDATEVIEGTLTSAIATLGEIVMANGTFTLTIKGDSVGSTTLTFVGEDGHGSTGITLTVSAYTATHSLVTSSSSLTNGIRVLFGCTATTENTNYSSAAHTGGAYVPTAPVGYASDRSSLAAGEHSREYTVWCVDSTNGYYVFSDGGYYLCAADEQGNHIYRTDVLSTKCYFTISNSSEGVLITSYFSVAEGWTYNDNPVDYTVQFNYNNGSPRFSLYRASSQKSSSVYVSGDTVDTVQGFVDVFMHLDNYNTESDYCKDSNHHYYSDAKAAYNNLTAAQKEDFCTESAYATAYDRLCHWAYANGDTIDSSYAIVTAPSNSIFAALDAQTSTSVIVIISVVGLTAIGGYFFIRKRRMINK